MLCDYHVHSSYSDDSVYPAEQVVRDAIRLNLDEICFTEHVDYGIKPDWFEALNAPIENGKPACNPVYPAYFKEVADLKQRYGEQIGIKRGLELGVQTHTEKQFEALLGQWSNQMDFAILSIHQVDNQEFWTGEFQQGRTQDAYNLAYYEEMLRVVTTFKGPWSVVGHFDLIRRYDPAGAYPFEKIRELVAEILRATIASGRGIELNTSSVRYHLDDYLPQTSILELYRDLGGTIVTIGSDSHKPDHLGSYIRRAKRHLSALGFSSFFTYEHFDPIEHPLEA